jgi:CHAT domain-containing protein
MVANFSESLGRKYPSWLLYEELCLIQNLSSQGRLVEAEIEARRLITKAVALGGKGSYWCAMACRQMGRILVQQNRLQEARAILETSITSAITSGTPPETPLVGEIRIELVEVLAMQGMPQEAADQFVMAEGCFRDRRYFTNNLLFRPILLAALSQAGRYTEALPLVEASREELADRLGPENPHTLVMQAVRGMVEDGMGNSSTAAEDYVAALPLLLSMATKKNGDSQHRWLVQALLEAYLDHLAFNCPAEGVAPISTEASRTAFHIAEALRHHGLSMAISAYSARGNAVDPSLRDLTRREQDARRQVEVLEATIGNLVAAPADQVDPDHIREVTEQLEQLKAARERILSEIQTTAPRYHNYLQPRSMELEAIHGLLRPKETMLVCHTTPRHTFVWAIPDSGIPRMEVFSAGREEITSLVASVRHSLDATPATLGDIPAFDMAAAHRLYQLLLLPLSDTWGKGQELLVITNAPLDRLPLGVLPIHLAEDNTPSPGLLFANYRRVDWLIRHAATSRHASVAAFAALRQTSTPAGNRKPFAGFGDPIFTLNRGKTDTGKSTLKADLDIRERGCAVKVRGVRVTVDGNLDAETLYSTCLRNLAPLPDTAEEVRSIAQALLAPPEKSVFLGADASEARIKAMDLSDRQVIAFATHALLPGDLDGLDQPALALSAPEVTGEAEDGLLTMGEIMTLRLDADWVVLSACDTGSASGAGREALSGLGAAFFYAGSRSLLVSLWPVETTSARHLTTGIFARQQADHRLGRAQALQEAILALMDSPGLTDPRTGQVAASYAHPMFWAPFILVGEGASEGHPAAQ